MHSVDKTFILALIGIILHEKNGSDLAATFHDGLFAFLFTLAFHVLIKMIGWVRK